ncbi:MAG: glucosamine-6-phosphate deaminase [Bacteroidetes bacterium]|nr:glucosamine-6-phosphate deaminase [Bacteroidota bacterium]
MALISPTELTYKAPGTHEENRFEKLHNIVVPSAAKGSELIAQEIADLIRNKQAKSKKCVLGLATGSSPLSVYAELVRMHKEEGLSFENVITFNLDEYWPMSKDNFQSYHHFMHENLFDHIDIKPENIHIPDGEVKSSQVRSFCQEYEAKIGALGGLDFQLLGIGRTGHIGFNEPGSNQNSRTRLVNLDHITREDAAEGFQGLEFVPKRAITMGIATVLSAKRVVLMAWGQKKSAVIQQAVEGAITSTLPSSFLQLHKNTTLVLDEEAAADLTRIKTPWLVQTCEWNDKLKYQAVVWLCRKTGKSVLKLTESDYNENALADLLETQSIYDLNIEIFNRLQHTITGWPGGKPDADDSHRPERARPKSKRVIIFSPHPDDDVISMGGTLDRLISQGHEVHVAYQTSGSIAVSNQEALKFIEVACDMMLGAESNTLRDLRNEIDQLKDGEIPSAEIRNLKTIIRQREAIAATRYLGLPDENVHFLKLPFYETGAVKKAPISQDDVDIMNHLIKSIRPHQIYAAGDLADPHGTHRLCIDALQQSLSQLRKEPFLKDCWVWLYRGAWHEYEPYEIDMAVPMSPAQVRRKRRAIFFHQTQKDGVMFQGNDPREFWVRAEDRNRETAAIYRDLGLSDYAAIEAFKRYYY